jgi:hypothetical protein
MLRLLLPSVTLCTLAAALAVTGVRAQTDLDAGKSGPQLFAQDCVACHRSPQALLKNISSFGLVGFLRQHYTSSSASANTLAAYIMSVANARPPAEKKGKAAEAQQQAKQAPARESRAAAQPPEAGQQHARQAEPADDPADQRANRRPRRPGAAETEAPAPAARAGEPAETPMPLPAPQQTAAVPAAPEAAPPPPPAPAEPGFTEPLP